MSESSKKASAVKTRARAPSLIKMDVSAWSLEKSTWAKHFQSNPFESLMILAQQARDPERSETDASGASVYADIEKDPASWSMVARASMVGHLANRFAETLAQIKEHRKKYYVRESDWGSLATIGRMSLRQVHDRWYYVDTDKEINALWRADWEKALRLAFEDAGIQGPETQKIIDQVAAAKSAMIRVMEMIKERDEQAVQAGGAKGNVSMRSVLQYPGHLDAPGRQKIQDELILVEKAMSQALLEGLRQMARTTAGALAQKNAFMIASDESEKALEKRHQIACEKLELDPISLAKLKADPELCEAIARLSFPDARAWESQSMSGWPIEAPKLGQIMAMTSAEHDAVINSLIGVQPGVREGKKLNIAGEKGSLTQARMLLSVWERSQSPQARDAIVRLRQQQKDGMLSEEHSVLLAQVAARLKAEAQNNTINLIDPSSMRYGHRRAREDATVGAEALEIAIQESQSKKKGSERLAQLLIEHVSQKQGEGVTLLLNEALARISKGYSDVGDDAPDEQLLPSLGSQKAGSVDPMLSVARSGEWIWRAGEKAEVSDNEAVSRAKQAMGQKLGLGSAAWKALASQPQVAALFERALLAKKGDEMDQERLAAAGASWRAGNVQAAGLMRAGAKEKAKQAEEEREKFEIAKSSAIALNHASQRSFSELDQRMIISLCLTSSKARELLTGAVPINGAEWEERPDRLMAILEDSKAMMSKGASMLTTLRDKMVKVRQAEPGSEEQKIAKAVEAADALISDVFDAARAHPPGFWAGLDPKHPMEHALRMHKQWVKMINEEEASKASGIAYSWEPVSAEKMSEHSVGDGKIEAMELTTGRALFEEGKAMDHCVSSYAERCANGSSRIFSLRIGGLRVATLELAPMGLDGSKLAGVNMSSIEARAKVGRWEPVQNRGKHNHAASQAATEAGALVAARVTEQFKKATEAMIKAQEKASKAGDVASKLEQRRQKEKEQGPDLFGPGAAPA